MNAEQLLLFVILLGGAVIAVVVVSLIFFFRWRKRDLAIRKEEIERRAKL